LDGLRGLIPFSKELPSGTVEDLVGQRNYNWLASAFISWINQADMDRQSQYDTYRNYYDGEHLYQLTDRMKEFLELDPNVKFDLNYLPLAVDVLAERLVVLGFSGDEEIGGLEGILAEWWKKNDMDAGQDDVHHSGLKDGDTYVIVGWDNEKKIPTFSHETAYDGDYGVGVRYHNDGSKKIRLAFKRWYVETGEPTQRMNIYTSDLIYKFVTTSGGWDIYKEEEGEEWPLPWVDKRGEPLGVPVIHFKTKGAGDQFGKSELHDLIPAQDALNKMVLDEIAGADIEGFGLITLSGGRPPDDMDLGPRKILYAPDGIWGSLAAGDLVALSDMVHNYIVRIAQLSRTPLQYFQSTKQIASEDTQRAYDTGIVSKADNISKHYGKSWTEAMRVGLRLDNTFGSGGWTDEQIQDIKTVWGTFERVDKLETEKKRADVAVRLVEGGASLRGALMVAGYSEGEIENLLLGAPLVSPIFLKAGGTGMAQANLLSGDTDQRDMAGGDVGGDVASSTARSD
jgi:hypothetical protein